MIGANACLEAQEPSRSPDAGAASWGDQEAPPPAEAEAAAEVPETPASDAPPVQSDPPDPEQEVAAGDPEADGVVDAEPSSPDASGKSASAKVTPKPPAGFTPLTLDATQLERAKKVQPFVAAAAIEYGIDPNLINGIIWAESKFNPKARNRSGAKGLMQLMPRTGKAMAEKVGRPFRPYNPEFSVLAGGKLLAILLERFRGDETLALFGYARGSGAVRKWQNNGGQIPEGVRKFIARVTRARHTFAQLGFPVV